MSAKVLVVDDEQSVCDLVQDVLVDAGHEVFAAVDGKEGLKAFYSWQPELVVLDISMPGMNGWDLLDRIREVSQTPVIILSALGREHETVRGLRSGADDYIVKPARTSELLARVEAALRKSEVAPEAGAVYQDSVVHVDLPRHQVHLQGQVVDLTPQEFRLLTALVQNAGFVLSTDRLSDLCWGAGNGGPENVRVYIGHLRKKLKDDPKRPRLIETVREFGYRYCPPGE